MAEVTTALIKELRDATNAGILDARKALQENGGDLEKAKDWRRQ
jgi:elongation factor Ts